MVTRSVANLCRFFLSKWDAFSEKLCIILPTLAAKATQSGPILKMPSTVQHEILRSFERLEAIREHEDSLQELLYRCDSYLDLMGTVTTPSVDDQNKIATSLRFLLEHALQDSGGHLREWMVFAAGRGLSYLMSNTQTRQHAQPLWRQLCAGSRKFKHIPGFMQAIQQGLHLLENTADETIEGQQAEPLLESVIDCLQSASHDLRLASLKILEAIYRAKSESHSEIISAALSIETSSFGVESLRAASMHIRKLASGYPTVSDEWLQRAIPAYCFGLLHVRLTPLAEDSCTALKEISMKPVGEETVARIALDWMQGSPISNEDIDQSTSLESSPSHQVLSDFEDFETGKLEHLFESAQETIGTTHDELRRSFIRRNKPLRLQTAQCRTQATRVLNKIPAIAEKRSRSVVPVLLGWTDGSDALEAEDMSHKAESPQSRWSRKDQKAMLDVFSQFVNPRVLYKSSKVYEALLILLCNGDVEIQRSALKAILTWKQPSVKRYEDHLMNILEDAKFREELAVFLNVEQDDSELQEKDKDELMPVLLRLLYGRIISRTGSSSGSGQQAKRKAVFVALTRFGSEEMAQFLDIILHPIHRLTLLRGDQFRDQFHEEPFNQELLSQRRQIGLLNMVEDLLEELGSGLAPFASQLTDATLYCIVRASTLLFNMPSPDDYDDDEQDTGLNTTSLRTIRQVGTRCLNLLFEHCPDMPWEAYIIVILHRLVTPRLDRLPIEMSQSPSGLLRMFSIWSGSLRYATFLVLYNDQIIEKITEILEMPFAKDQVKCLVIRDIVGRIVTLTDTNASGSPTTLDQQWLIREKILQANANTLLTRLSGILKGSPSKDLLDVAVHAVSRLGAFVVGSSDSRTLVETSVFLLQQPSRRVQPHIKNGILGILDEFVPKVEFNGSDALFSSTYETVASLFGYLQDRAGQQPNRPLLCNVFGRLAQIDHKLKDVADLCNGLNAMSTTRLDEPDFERRSTAFRIITEDRCEDFSVQQWQPLVYNMLFFIKDETELIIRTNASYGLRRFVEHAASIGAEGPPADGFEPLMSTALLPGIFGGIRDSPELVRIEYLSVLATVIRQFPRWNSVNDMQTLLMGDDEEASFFSNVLHIQQHRRLRALRRLGTEAKSGILQSKNISRVFIPLIEHFIFDRAEDETAHNLSAEAIATIRALATHLEWSQYRATLQRYLAYLHNKPEGMQKTVIRLLGAAVDALDSSASKVSTAIIQSFIVGTALTPLTEYLHRKDESTVSLRVPIAVTVVKLLRHLPPEELSLRLPPVLMDICHILRSRDQGSRDMTRKTLAEILSIIGPSYFGFIVKELRSALQRGYQLHVLSFTIHSMLIDAIPSLKPGDLDYCITDIVSVIMDDIFGVTGQEKDADEYTSKMKEVKSSKSFDSMDLIAKVTTLGHLSKLIRPIQALLLEKLNVKMVRKTDELLRRISLGVSRNEAVQDQKILVFCYEVIQDVYGIQSNPNPDQQSGDYKIKRYLINMKGSAKSGNRGSTSSYLHKLVRFSLDLTRSVLQRHEGLKTPTNLSGFMPMVGDALVGAQEEIQISAIRLLTAIAKVPLPHIDNNASFYIGEAVRIIKASPSTNTEISLAALKLISAILRERKATDVKETDLAYLLQALMPDLREPDRQGVVFNFVRAVLARKVVINEVYKLMDEVAAIMVTNQTRSIRESARGAYFQFLMEYPQGRKRLEKQLDFLCQNLDYKYAEGRQSVMEITHLLLSKTGDEPVQEMLTTFFPFLVLQLNNDEDKECQEMLEALLKTIFERADATRQRDILAQLRSYLEQEQQPILKKVALRIWMMYLREKGESAKDTQYVQHQVEAIITNAPAQIADPSTALVLPTALSSGLSLCKVFPAHMFSEKVESMWGSIISLSVSRDIDIQVPAVQLLGLLFNDFASHNTDSGLQQLPLSGSGGIELNDDGLLQLMVGSLRTMQGTALDSEILMNQTIRNLVFLGRCFGVNGILWQPSPMLDAETAEDDEDSAAEFGEQNTPKKQRSAIQYLFARLSHIVRRNETLATTSSPRLPALILLGALVNHLSVATLADSLQTILTALNHLTDPSITHSTQSSQTEKLDTLAHEIVDKVKDKVGTPAFVKSMEEVRGQMRQRRDERRKKRALDKVTEEGLKRMDGAKRRKVEARRAREKETRITKGVIYKGKRKRLYE